MLVVKNLSFFTHLSVNLGRVFHRDAIPAFDDIFMLGYFIFEKKYTKLHQYVDFVFNLYGPVLTIITTNITIV